MGRAGPRRRSARRVAMPPRRRALKRSPVVSSSQLRKGVDRSVGRPGERGPGVADRRSACPSAHRRHPFPARAVYRCGAGAHAVRRSTGPGARGAARSGRAVTQKHRQSTLRSTSGGCLLVTRREDCGRVSSKRRCRAARIMPIIGRHGLRLRIFTPRFGLPGVGASLSVQEPGGSRVIVAREVSPRGMGDVGLARHTTRLAAQPGPAVRPPRPAPHVSKAMSRPHGTDAG